MNHDDIVSSNHFYIVMNDYAWGGWGRNFFNARCYRGRQNLVIPCLTQNLDYNRGFHGFLPAQERKDGEKKDDIVD